jgi:hypothetical protein
MASSRLLLGLKITSKKALTMKTLLAICLFAVVPFTWALDGAGTPAPGSAVYQGQVLEVKDVESYTYLRLQTKEGEVWAAVSTAPVKPGDKVTIDNATVMNNFESKSLHKTFPTIVFGNLAGAGTDKGLPPGHPSVSPVVSTELIQVPKASGANAQTVEAVNARRVELKDQVVLVRGKVVKYTPSIMGKNWIHLRDGTGSAANNTNDIVVTTTSKTKAGDIVTAKGKVRIDKDFGSGYAYKVLIEEATLQP